jgi:hypothetical protein
LSVVLEAFLDFQCAGRIQAVAFCHTLCFGSGVTPEESVLTLPAAGGTDAAPQAPVAGCMAVADAVDVVLAASFLDFQ